jgi:hypothetical protein
MIEELVTDFSRRYAEKNIKKTLISGSYRVSSRGG